MPPIDITDKIGFALLKKGVIDYETLEKSLKIKDGEDKKNRRNLGQILVNDFGADHDAVFREVADLYAFREVYLADEAMDGGRVEFIKKYVDGLPQNVRDMVVQSRMLPLRYDEKQPDKLIIVAADPTDRRIPLIAREFGAKKYEVAYCRLKDLQNLLEQVIPPQNEFLKLLEDSKVGIQVKEEDDENALDEDALEAEISKSALVNLVEGALVEAVRSGASDVHIIAKEGNRTEFWFRTDGNLKLWHVQEKTMPEAVAAVVKDRSKNVDRFEREASQDGFIQRLIDDHMIRFRVSIMPIVGVEFRHKYESIVIRVLDDRKVITDLSKLGLQGPARQFFHQAIAKPQGIVILTGPTGSGKSTTLIAALHQVIDPDGERADRGGPGGVHYPGRAAAADQPEDEFRPGHPGHSAPRSRHRAGGRDARQGHGGNRREARQHGSPDILHAPHQRRAQRGGPSVQDGGRALPDRLCHQHHRGPAPRAHALQAVQAAAGKGADRPGGLSEVRVHRRRPRPVYDLRSGRLRQVQRRATRDGRRSMRPSTSRGKSGT